MTPVAWYWYVITAVFALLAFGLPWLAWRRFVKSLFTPPNADAAKLIVWAFYEQLPSTMPRVFWLLSDDGTFKQSFGGKRVYGDTPHAGVCNVGWRRDGWDFADSALAHELWHAALKRRGGDTEDHSDPGFGPGSMVDQANMRLRAWEAGALG